jgi:hypothetical protein
MSARERQRNAGPDERCGPTSLAPRSGSCADRHSGSAGYAGPAAQRERSSRGATNWAQGQVSVRAVYGEGDFLAVVLEETFTPAEQDL